MAGLSTYLWQQRRKNRQTAHNVADDLAARRAFEPIEPSEGGLGTDGERCASSVRATQQGIALFRNDVTLNTKLRAELNEMVLACVEFKDNVDHEPDRWQFSLMILRSDLLNSLRNIERVLKMKAGSLSEPGVMRATHRS